MATYILFFLLFLLPFVVLPFGVTPFETPKVIIAELGIVLLIVVTLYKKSIKSFFKKAYILHVIIFFLTIFQIIVITSDTLFLGNAFRLQGIFLLWLLLGFSIIVTRVKFQTPSAKIIFLLLCIHLVLAFLITGTNEERAIGTIGEPNAYAASLLFFWPFLFFKNNPTRKDLFLQYGGLIITGIIILATGSRSGMVALALQIVFFLLYMNIKLSLKKSLIIVLILFFATLLLPFLDTKTVYERRDEIWIASLIAGYEHPVTGWGFGNTEKALEKYNDKLYNSAHGYYVDSSHNIFLDWWVQGGLIGLSIVVLLVYQAVQVFVQKNEAMYLMMFVGILAAMAFNPVSVVILIQFFFLIGESFKSDKTI